MDLSGDFAFLNFVVPNRLHAGGHQVWQLLKEETDALAPTGFMPNGVDLSSCCDPIRLVRIGELAIVFEVGIAKKEGMPRSWCFSRRYQKNEGHPHGQ